MSPTAAAAIAGLKISVGIDQNTEIYAFPAVIRVNIKTTQAAGPGRNANPNKPRAATSRGIAQCHRLSQFRSECHPFNGIATKHTR